MAVIPQKPWLMFQVLHFWPISLLMLLERHKTMAQVPGSPHPCRSSWRSSCLLLLAWSRPSRRVHLQSEPMMEDLFVSHCHSALQINKTNLKEKNLVGHLPLKKLKDHMQQILYAVVIPIIINIWCFKENICWLLTFEGTLSLVVIICMPFLFALLFRFLTI